MTDNIMKPGHPRWREFLDRLVVACDFHRGNGDITCECRADYSFSRKVLREMGLDVQAAVDWFRDADLWCDCNILLYYAVIEAGRGTPLVSEVENVSS